MVCTIAPGRTEAKRALRVRRPPVGVALLVTVAAEAALVAFAHVNGLEGVVLAVVAAAGWGLVVSDPRLESWPRSTVCAIALAFGVAIAAPPRGSHDLWSYVMYGRTLAVHHASPYLHAPADYPRDPFLHLVGSGWAGTKSVYGPLFTVVSAGLAKVAGASVLRARLAFQGFALLGVVAVLAALWIESRSVRTVAFVGLHPAVVLAIVNGGHNDGLVGLAVLVGAVLVRRRRFTAAGVAVGLGMLVKASTGLGILGIAIWSFGRDRRQTVRFLVVAALTTGVGYLPVGTAALRTLADSRGRTSRASVWSPISSLIHGSVGDLALVLVVALAVIGALRFRAQALPSLAATGSIAAYLLAGAYVLPWYPAWALPSAALARRSWLSVLVAVHAALLVAVYELPARSMPGSSTAWLGGAFVVGAAVVVLAGFTCLLVGSRSAPRAATRAS
jgi:MYXO-CTERM domain-containing protein